MNPDRRKLLSALARWSVPTVVTIAFSARPLQAKASCPPCRKRNPPVTGTCRPCTVNQMLSCQCEPCLGPPYCSGASSVVAPPGSLTQPAAPGSQGIGTSPFNDPRREALRQIQLERQRRRTTPNAELFPDPFRLDRPGGQRQPAPSLYERLQQTPQGRRN